MFSFISQFLRDLKAQKLRSLMTLFGITWGTVAVVLLLAFGTGLQRNALQEMHGMGERIVLLWPQRTTKPYEGMGIGRRIRLTVEDVHLLKREIPGIEAITPENTQRNAKMKHADKAINAHVSGVFPVFEDLRNMFPAAGGRFINPLDVKNKKRVIFIGNELKEDLFGEDEAIGKRISMNGIPFVVVGVLQEKNQSSSYSGSDSEHAYIPATTFFGMYNRPYIEMLLYRPKTGYPSDEVANDVYRVLGSKHKFDPEDKDALGMWDTTDIDKILFYVFLGINILLGIGGSCTLLVGGIGVANIMYIVIRERTGEIGIKMALGAKPGHILSQFMLETMMIVALGGFVGLLISIGGVKIVSLLPIEEYVGTPVISPIVAAVTAAILGIIGLLAGYFPAKRAAAMSPVQALAIGKFG